MTIPTTAGTVFPARLAYSAAVLFTVTSAATNAVYGWHKGADLPTSLIWLTVSVAASIVFALSVPALLKSFSAKKWAQALLVCIGLVVCGSYSVVAALGSASGGRADAAVVESTLHSARARSQAAYDAAKAELATLKPTRPVAELEALKASWHQRMGKREPWYYEPDLARAKRRAELEQKIEAARLELSAPTTRQANSDAAALAGYLGALGWKIEADTLNKLLALLAVLVIELGGGASLAVGLALGDRTEPAHNLPAANGARTDSVPPLAAEKAHPPQTPIVIGVSGAAGGSQQGEAPTRIRLLQMVTDAAGVLRTSERALGSRLGVSSTRARRLLGELATAGAIKVRTSSTGTVISLVGSVEAQASVH